MAQEVIIAAGETMAQVAARYGISTTRLRHLLGGINQPSAGTFDIPIDLPDPITPAPLGVLAGGELVRLRSGPLGIEDDIWYQIYEFPAGSGFFVAYQFDSPQQVEAVFGKDADITTRHQTWWDRQVVAEAQAESIIGARGTFQLMADEIMKDAALGAGINDPSLVGQIAADPEMRDIMTQAILGDWTPEQIRAEQRQTTFWTDVLYPGIDTLYGKTTDPEKAWLAYEKSVSTALGELGYDKDANGTYDSTIGRMLDTDIDAEAFLSQVPTFLLAVQNSAFAQTLNQWAERDLGKSIDFNNWFDLMAGESQPELDAVVERAQLAFESQNAGLNLGVASITDLAARTELSQAEAVQTFASMQQTLLALGDVGLARGNLTSDEILRTFAGIDPGSGRSVQEVKLQIAKLSKEQGLFDDEKLNFFVGFTPGGVPSRPGLASLTPEGA